MLSPRPRLSTTERLRLFKHHGGVCHVCKGAIGIGQEWEIDHVTARKMKGEGCEAEADTDGNMRPAHFRCHKRKTADDVRRIAKMKRAGGKHLGASRSERPLPCGRHSRFKRRIGGAIVLRDEVRP